MFEIGLCKFSLFHILFSDFAEYEVKYEPPDSQYNQITK